MKSVALIAVIAGCFLLGRMKAHSYKERTDALKTLCLFISFIRDNIAYLNLPLKEIVLGFSRRTEPKNAEFIRRLCENDIEKTGFEEAFREATRDLPLKLAEREELMIFCADVGKTDRETQLSVCDITLKNLNRYKEEALCECQRLGKMWTCLGALLGAFLAIMLI